MDKLSKTQALSHQRLMTMLDELNTNLQHQVLTDPGVVIGSSSAAKMKITNTTKFLNGGIFKSKSTAEVAFTATTHDITADADTIQEACYLLTVAAGGTATITKGTTVDGSGNAKLPAIPSGGTPFGYLRLAVAAGSTDFNASSDDLSDGHLTDTFYSIGFLSPRFDAEQ